MLRFAFPGAALLALAPPSLAQHGHQMPADAGELFRSRCINCHVPPDARFEVDRAWLTQVSDTAWTSTPQEARAALIEYLEKEPLPLPAVVSAPPESLGADEAVLTPAFERGALLLRAKDGQFVRVSWEERGEVADRRRALPAGEYALVGYRLIRADEHGVTWHVSAGGKTIRELELAAGSEQKVEIDPAIRMATSVKHEDFGVAIQGESGAGLSIYKEGKRIPLGYRRLDAHGKPLAEGKINYG